MGAGTLMIGDFIMASSTSSFNLVQLVQSLQDQQEQYAGAMEALAATLAQQQQQHAEATAAIADTLSQQEQQHAQQLPPLPARWIRSVECWPPCWAPPLHSSVRPRCPCRKQCQ